MEQKRERPGAAKAPNPSKAITPAIKSKITKTSRPSKAALRAADIFNEPLDTFRARTIAHRFGLTTGTARVIAQLAFLVIQ